jgi:hypothetical protein
MINSDVDSLLINGEAFEKLNNFAHKLIPEYASNLEINNLSKTAELGTVALSRKLLLNPDADAVLVHHAAKNILSDKMLNYEPETIWLELEKFDLDVPEENRAKILMLNAIQATEPLIYDSAVFKNMALIFNDEVPNYEVMEEIRAEQLAWTVAALELISPKRTFYFDYEPKVYIASVLHRDGFVLAPIGLEFAQDELDSLNNNLELKKEVKLAKADVLYIKDNPLKYILEEQLRKLTRVNFYVKERFSNFKKEFNKLLNPEEIGEKIAKILKEKQKLTERKTSFINPEAEVGVGTIRGNEKSGRIDPYAKGLDVQPPKFTLGVMGA